MLSQLRSTSIAAEKQGDVVVISIVGPVSASGGDLLLRAAIADALDAGERRIAIDFSGLSTLDSSGLGELVRASGAVGDSGAEMTWVGCPKTMLDLFEITDVDFAGVECVDSIDAAIEILT